MVEPNNKTEPRKDRKLPVLRLQRMIAAIERRITSENEQTPADQKLKAKEMIGLANAAAGISRVLREVDRESICRSD
jgi:hypothetical protein